MDYAFHGPVVQKCLITFRLNHAQIIQNCRAVGCMKHNLLCCWFSSCTNKVKLMALNCRILQSSCKWTSHDTILSHWLRLEHISTSMHAYIYKDNASQNLKACIALRPCTRVMRITLANEMDVCNSLMTACTERKLIPTTTTINGCSNFYFVDQSSVVG